MRARSPSPACATADDELYDPKQRTDAPEPGAGRRVGRDADRRGSDRRCDHRRRPGAAIAALMSSSAAVIVAAAVAGVIIGGTAAAIIALMPEFGSEEGERAVHLPESATTGVLAVPTSSLAQAERVGVELVQRRSRPGHGRQRRGHADRGDRPLPLIVGRAGIEPATERL